MDPLEHVLKRKFTYLLRGKAHDLLDHRADIIIAVVLQVAPIRDIERILQHSRELRNTPLARRAAHRLVVRISCHVALPYDIHNARTAPRRNQGPLEMPDLMI